MREAIQQVVIYVRKSTESEDRQALSIDSQIDELITFAARSKLTVVEILRESQSAKMPGRPVFDELMHQVDASRVNAVLCWKLDRLARNPIDGGRIIWALEQGQISHVHTPQHSFVNTSNDKFWMQMEFGMAKKYIDDLSENVERGIRARIKLGWKCGRAPVGYLNDRSTKTIVPDPEKFAQVRQVWDLMLTGQYSPARIHSLLIQNAHQGLIPAHNLYRLFRNRFYCGFIVHNDSESPGRHKPMITEEEFESVQRLIKSRGKPTRTRHQFTYRGLMQCGYCGGNVTAEHKYNRQGHHYIYYHCTGRSRLMKCHQRAIEEKEVERQLLTFFRSIEITRARYLNLSRNTNDEQTRHMLDMLCSSSGRFVRLPAAGKGALARSLISRMTLLNGEISAIQADPLQSIMTG